MEKSHVIAMEVLARHLESQFNAGAIGYHPKARDMKISHLAFADDLMVFFDGKQDSLEGLINTLDVFHWLSGLEMNWEKSAIYLAGLNVEEAEGIAEFGFNKGTFPFIYLGLPLTHMKLRKSEYSPLVDSIATRFTH